MSSHQQFSFNCSVASKPAPARNPRRRPAANALQTLGSALALLIGAGVATPAQAVDGCVVLLCFAAPSWRSIPQCVPPIRQVLRDLARGRAFPTCGMAGAGNSASQEWAQAPHSCPAQYVREHPGPNGPIYRCDYSGAISVVIKGQAFTRTWWSMAGDSVTEFSPAAKAQLGTWDTRFDDEYAAWLAALPPPAEANP